MVTSAFVSDAARVNALHTKCVQLGLLAFNSLVGIMADHHAGHHMDRLSDSEVQMIRFVSSSTPDPITERLGN